MGCNEKALACVVVSRAIEGSLLTRKTLVVALRLAHQLPHKFCVFRRLHWKESRLDLKSGLLKTMTRKYTLDTIGFLLEFKGNPLKLRG